VTQQLTDDGHRGTAPLTELVRRLADEPDLEEVWAATVTAAARVAGVSAAVLYTSQGGPWFRRVAADGKTAAPEALWLDEGSLLWPAARDGAVITWSGDRPSAPWRARASRPASPRG
jgi:hypothetical protein